MRGQDAATDGAPAGGSVSTGASAASVIIMGDQVTLDLRGVNLLEALRIISEKTGMKFVVPGDLANLRISVYLREVPIDLAMRAILSANGLYMEQQGVGDIYVVKSLEKVPPLHIAVITLSHIKAKEIESIVKSNLSAKGQVVIDMRSNALIVRDTEDSVDLVRRRVSALDTASPQVLIRAHIVEVESSAEKQLGIDWSTVVSANGSSQAIVAPFSKRRPWIYNSDRPGEGSGDVELLPSFTYGKLDFTGLGATLRFLEDKGHAKVLASPSIATRNDEEASIKIVRHMALTVQTVFDDSGNVVQRVPIYGDVGITLVTRPWVNKDGLVTLQIEPTVSSAEQSSYFTEAVDTKTRTAKTEITVRDGDVIVIGGLLRTDVIHTKKKVPILGSIPFLGRLFSYERKVKDETDLVIFVSPKVLKDKEIDKKARQETKRIEGWDSAKKLLKGRTSKRTLFELPGLDPPDPYDKIKKIQERRKAARAESTRTVARRIPVLDGSEKRLPPPPAPTPASVTASAASSEQPDKPVTQPLVVKVDQQPDVVVTGPAKAQPPVAPAGTAEAAAGAQQAPENGGEAKVSPSEEKVSVATGPATGEGVGEGVSPITRAFEIWLSLGPGAEDGAAAGIVEKDNAAPATGVVPEIPKTPETKTTGVPEAKAASIPDAKPVQGVERTADAAFAAWLDSAGEKGEKATGEGKPESVKAKTSDSVAAERVVMRETTGK